jgi:hypothetical protein
MKPEILQIYDGLWYWRFGMGSSDSFYTRRRDAVRGFARHCAAIKKAGK